MPEFPLKFVGGHPALDFVNTVAWPEPMGERLTSYERLVRWSEAAGLLARSSATRLLARARREPSGATAALARALSDRILLHRLFARRSAGQLESSDLRDLNRALRDIAPRRHLSASGHAIAWAWQIDDDLESPLWPVIWSAAELLASDEAAQIRMCPGDGCGWMFVDQSRNGLRRWCEMQTCGTVAKSRRRATSKQPSRAADKSR
ncbi:MAG TPA: ABATE domain-containing protein [Thermoanaerobaculia bacterium]